MKPLWKLAAIGIAVYLIFLVATLPASAVFNRLSARGVNAVAVSGTVWNGHAAGLQAGVLSLGDVDWKLKFWPLFVGKAAADLKLKRPDGFAQAAVSAGLSGRIVLRDVNAALPIDAVVGSSGLPGGWKGQAQAKLSELVLEQAWPVAAKGTIDMVDLTGPAQQPANIGTYRVSFPGGQSADKAPKNALVGTIEDLQAAISVSGTITLSPGRNYLLEMLVAARPNAPDAVKDGMQFLGAPDAQGRRPFSVSGTM